MVVDIMTCVAANLSVNINGVLVPIREMIKAISRYSRPLFLSYPGTNPPFQFFGTSFYFCYKDIYYSVITRHQSLDSGAEIENHGILTDDFDVDGERYFATPSQKIEFKNSGNEYEDIIIFSYNKTQFKDDRIFLRLSDDNLMTGEPDLLFLFFWGFPSEMQDKFECDDNGYWSVHNKKKVFHLEIEGTHDFGDLVSHRLKSASEIEMDGVSGSPVFAYERCVGKVSKLFFYGIVCRSGKEEVHILPMADILRRGVFK